MKTDNNKIKLSIKNWNVQDQPREKMIAKGCGALSDAELLAILIGMGNKEESALDLAKRILSSLDNNLSNLGGLSIHDLIAQFKGIGEAKAVTIITALELGRRRSESQASKLKIITSSKHIFEMMQPVMEDLRHEEFWCLFLSRANKVLKKIKVSQGGVAGTVVDNRIILKHAITHLASGIVICHNHPSGNIQPSKNDVEITKKLIQAALPLDIVILDHLIITNENYFSFADEKMLQ